MKKINIFDTTLRDGEQSPGASLNKKEKLEIAKQLARLKVDVIEAGFPISSKGNFEAVKEIAKEVKGSAICALARAKKEDIDAAYKSIKPAEKSVIHVFLATSKIHMKYKLKKAEDEIVKSAVEAVEYAKKFSDNIEFSPEDASRTNPNFLVKIVSEVIEAGANIVNIPDTVGYSIPEEFGNLIAKIKKEVPNIEQANVSVHCHNDLGLGVANSLAAIQNGTDQVECTINGIGERAGNAALEEIVMALATRKDFLKYKTDINTPELYKTSRLISKLTGMKIQPNKAIVGENAFSHESGIHQDGVLKERSTYEIMDPSMVGFGESRIVLGKLSGRHAFKQKLKELGFELAEEEVNKAFKRFKALADKKREIFDEDLQAVIEEEIVQIPKKWSLDYIHTSSGNDTVPTATVRLRKEGKILQDAACGDGPVDACYKTIDRITKVDCQLLSYDLDAITEGKDALGEVVIKIRSDDTKVTGKGTSTDIIEASAKAYLDAINRLYYRKGDRLHL